MAAMNNLMDIVNRNLVPPPWTEGDNIPWNEPEFSERMLAEHLSQEHDLASRKSSTIDEHVDWIFTTVLGARPGRLLDLGCGPGLYAHRLTARGCECVGMDFSPASIRYAREATAADNSPCRFILADLREEAFGVGFDLVMMIYGQFNVFPRHYGLEILRKAHAALGPGGRLLLELQSAAQIQRGGEDGPSWYSAPSGLFSAQPHLVLQENFWDAEAAASTTRWSVIDAETASVRTFALSNEAYAEEEIDDALRAAGFVGVRRYPSLSGKAASGEADLPVVVADR
ncbi:MAG: class I SAM-dependent methyltransferase [Holophagae bacterium]|jgi:SAM-dependent methyltransferase